MNPSEETALICRLCGAKPEQIVQKNDGFLSRAYLIDDGRIVFKFKKEENADYSIEEKMLNFIGTLCLPVNVQKVGWTSPDGSYIGLYGVFGQSLESLSLSYAKKMHIGTQIGEFLKILHLAEWDQAQPYPVSAEIGVWQERYQYGVPVLQTYFSSSEMQRIDDLMMEEMPLQLKMLGENPVLSHGDLGGGNILVDEEGNVGVIDFSEMLYLDEAADFMDTRDEDVCRAMLDAYDAGGNLRRKVFIRRLIRPIFVIGTYAFDERKREADLLAEQIRKTILS
ncbi:MAG: aminoglycoside phosphotransferase family protein [Firmicutes bacterium]|nr:aminoglycoside phosphotransferase family protein [Bacillota bacterium]